MDVATFWDQVRSALGLDEPSGRSDGGQSNSGPHRRPAHDWDRALGRRLGAASRNARDGVYAEVATLLSRADDARRLRHRRTVVLAIVGTSWTAIAAVLGAATLRHQPRPSGCRPRISSTASTSWSSGPSASETMFVLA